MPLCYYLLTENSKSTGGTERGRGCTRCWQSGIYFLLNEGTIENDHEECNNIFLFGDVRQCYRLEYITEQVTSKILELLVCEFQENSKQDSM